eukprot:COSAG01_NODE_11508_length_1926_cov_0.942308_2_plen_70_part_00
MVRGAWYAQDWFGITFPDSMHPSSAFARWYAAAAQDQEADTGGAAVTVREVDARWPHSKSCWVGDHGFC